MNENDRLFAGGILSVTSFLISFVYFVDFVVRFLFHIS